MAFSPDWLSVKRVIELHPEGEIGVGRWISWFKAVSIAKSSPDNISNVFVGATVIEETGKPGILGLWIPMPIRSFRAKLSVKIARADRFWADWMTSFWGKIVHDKDTCQNGWINASNFLRLLRFRNLRVSLLSDAVAFFWVMRYLCLVTV